MECFFDLRYTGAWASDNAIQFYDVAQALIGFERVISLTTHLLLNGEVKTQSPATSGFNLVALPAEEGSWKWTVGLALGAGQLMHAFGTAPPDTAFGWLTKSAVEYVVQETLGFTPNFEETLGAQIERYRDSSPRHRIDDSLSIDRFDSLIEKTESGVKALHRPIVKSNSAETGQIEWRTPLRKEKLDVFVNAKTFEYIDQTITTEDFSEFCGHVSSYNANTFKGRIYLPDQHRTVPFELAESMRSLATVRLITQSLSTNATAQAGGTISKAPVCMKALRNEATTGRLKSIYVVGLSSMRS
ncbi:hypothetical protein [Celeribacter halophilus]|uniref:DUF7946 domain-containing protein n=1 Tax=Celeribacter halophilus TaxID=576117 RepID=UPI003A95BFA2